MQDIELLSWQHKVPRLTLTVSDEPIATINDLAVYELISPYQSIAGKVPNRVRGPYKHIAVRGTEVFMFDWDRQECVTPLGQFKIHHR